MFTGLIHNQGTITECQLTSDGGKITIQLKTPEENIQLGESVALNGCCLTVVKQDGLQLTFDVSDETMRKTSFANFKTGFILNVERALQVGARLGGHFVLGHVDGVGKIQSISEENGSIKFTIAYPEEGRDLLIDKGSVTVDGISLTVCDLTDETFSVYIIPHTLQETHLAHVKAGQVVNLEFDVLGKYVLRSQLNQK